MDNYIIIDIETPYSLYPEDGIREVAALVIQDNKIIDTLHLAIIADEEEYRNGYGAGLEAIETNEEFKNQFKELLKKYPYPLVAHNAPFEKKFLQYWGWLEPDFDEIYCSMRAIRYSYELDSYKMETLIRHFGIAEHQQHTALSDVSDLFEILKATKPTKWYKVGESYSSKHDAEYERLNREEVKQRLAKAKENLLTNIFNGKKVVFTGKMGFDRTTMMEIALHYGATTANTVSRKTDILVVGKDAGSKLKKAMELGIRVITEKEFVDMLPSMIDE